MIYLLIASRGDFSDKTTWIVEVYTDEAAAVEEAARLNVMRKSDLVMWDNYMKRHQKLRGVMAGIALAEEGRSDRTYRAAQVLPEYRWGYLSRDQQKAIDAKIVTEIGPWPEGCFNVDDYTVVAVPIGERGKWELP